MNFLSSTYFCSNIENSCWLYGPEDVRPTLLYLTAQQGNIS